MDPRIEYSDASGADRIEKMLLSGGDTVPRHIRARLEGHIREYRSKPVATPDAGAPTTDLTTEQMKARAVLASL